MFILANIKAKTPDQLFKPGIKKYLKFQTSMIPHIQTKA